MTLKKFNILQNFEKILNKNIKKLVVIGFFNFTNKLRLKKLKKKKRVSSCIRINRPKEKVIEQEDTNEKLTENTRYKTNMSSSNNIINTEQLNKIDKGLPSWKIAEQKEFEECTFRPLILKSASLKNGQTNQDSVFIKLHKEHKIRTDRKYYKTIEKINEENNELTFRPTLNISKNMKKCKSLTNLSYRHNDISDFLSNLEKVN